MKNSQTVIRSILGTADVDIRPLAYAVDAAVELLSLIHISEPTRPY